MSYIDPLTSTVGSLWPSSSFTISVGPSPHFPSVSGITQDADAGVFAIAFAWAGWFYGYNRKYLACSTSSKGVSVIAAL